MRPLAKNVGKRSVRFTSVVKYRSAAELRASKRARMNTKAATAQIAHQYDERKS